MKGMDGMRREDGKGRRQGRESDWEVGGSDRGGRCSGRYRQCAGSVGPQSGLASKMAKWSK